MPGQADGVPVNFGARGLSDYSEAGGARTVEGTESPRPKDGQRDSGGSPAGGVSPGAVERSPVLVGEKMEPTEVVS